MNSANINFIVYEVTVKTFNVFFVIIYFYLKNVVLLNFLFIKEL